VLAVIEAVSRLDTRTKTSPATSDAEALQHTLSAGGATAGSDTGGSNEQRARNKLWLGVLVAAAGGTLGWRLLTSRAGSRPDATARPPQAAIAPAAPNAIATAAATMREAPVLPSPSSMSVASSVSSTMPAAPLQSSARRREQHRAVSSPRSIAAPAVSDTSTRQRDPVYDERK
jgi:hypothetical protein